jgi:hypothetical protein
LKLHERSEIEMVVNGKKEMKEKKVRRGIFILRQNYGCLQRFTMRSNSPSLHDQSTHPTTIATRRNFSRLFERENNRHELEDKFKAK